MASKKRDLEIIYNLVWKNRLLGNDRSNIVCMYDVPSTTLNWEIFKSYLLKNSGTSTEDVKVYYVDCNDRELPIESQDDFQIALYSFRKRARDGDINNLKLEKVAEPKLGGLTLPKRKILKVREDVKTDVPPEWFSRYMNKFKKELLEEVNASVMKINTSKKVRSDTMKTMIQTPLNIEYLKSMKHGKVERKLENKLEKLEHKTMKIKAKKLALKESSDYAKKTTVPQSDIELMNVSMVNPNDLPIIHVLAGDSYMHHWEVLNTGKLAWTKNTEICFAWGSQDLIPNVRVVKCPHLNPGEKGLITTYYTVPENPGIYECYWHFHHNGFRFGQWLGLRVCVDDVTRRSPEIKTDRTEVNEALEWMNIMQMKGNEGALQEDAFEAETEIANEVEPTAMPKLNTVMEQMQSLQMKEEESQMAEQEEISETDKPDVDSVSVLSMNGSNSSGEDYVMVSGQEKIVKQQVEEDEQEVDVGKNEELNVAEDVVNDYAFIYYNGEKYPFHKKYLKHDYFQQVEKVPSQWMNLSSSSNKESMASSFNTVQADSDGPSSEAQMQTMLSSCDNRLFVFPNNSPGFEVVPSASGYQTNEHRNHDLVTTSPSQMEPEQQSHNNAREPEVQNKPKSGADNSFASYGNMPCPNHACGSNLPENRCCFKERVMSEMHQQNAIQDEYESERQSNYSSRSSASRQQSIASENLLTGAALLASSAMSTARSMMDMVMQGGNWVNGHWVSDSPNSKRESALAVLSEMGFNDRDFNATLLARYNDDVVKVVSELVQ